MEGDGVPTYALVLGGGVGGEAVDGAHVLRGELVGRPQLDLRLHVGQVDLGGQRPRAVVTLLGFLDEVVCRMWKDMEIETQLLV